MKTRIELANIACMTSEQVMGVFATFELPRRSAPAPKPYLYKCPRALGETLQPGDLVLAHYEGQQSSQIDRPVTSCLVQRVVDAFDPEDMGMTYRWIIGRVDLTTLRELQKWEVEVTDALIASQRRKAREAVLQEVAGALGDVARPSFPRLAAVAEMQREEQEEVSSTPIYLEDEDGSSRFVGREGEAVDD